MPDLLPWCRRLSPPPPLSLFTFTLYSGSLESRISSHSLLPFPLQPILLSFPILHLLSPLFPHSPARRYSKCGSTALSTF